ncbi:MAG TPA: MarR family transcriptional regulator [Pyrinomonadaceae bacterium]|nr:MarR family transcriptional regulator [Pyrinomonadaceae bacterium]
MNDNCGLKDVSTDLLLTSFLKASQRFEARVEAALGQAGLSLAKLGVLAHLVQAGEPLPLGRLAEKISCVKSNMTQLMDRLEADGLVTRVSDSTDRRCVRAAITAEGRNRYRSGARVLEEVEQSLLSSISSAERDQLLTVLSRITND